MKHKHIWKNKESGHGLPPKQNMADPIIFDGFKADCECGVWIFFPNDQKLTPVEIQKEH